MSSEIEVLRQGAQTMAVKFDPLPAGNAKAEDEKFVRESIRTSIGIGIEALVNARDLFATSEDSKALRALAGLIVAISSSADKLTGIHQTGMNQRRDSQDDRRPDGVNEDGKKIWLGSPKDLQNFLDQNDDSE
jgi:hypothetical protein